MKILMWVSHNEEYLVDIQAVPSVGDNVMIPFDQGGEPLAQFAKRVRSVNWHVFGQWNGADVVVILE